jgi:hypothetical protein
MPQINSIPEVLYQPNQPYHHIYDNLPLKNILTRIGMVNIQVDTNTDVLRGAAGSVGSLNDRLDVSLQENGFLKTSAVDDALHSIESHTDGDNYVRMTTGERSKLGLVLDGANRCQIEIENIDDSMVTFPPNLESGTLKLVKSPSIFFEFTAPDELAIHSNLPPDIAHRHHYDALPAYDNPSSPSFQHYKTTSLNTPFMDGTLRVYVNGSRLTDEAIKVMNYGSSSTSWVSTYVSAQDPETGTFSLNRALNVADVIRIDFDELIGTPLPVFSSSSSSSNLIGSSSSSS